MAGLAEMLRALRTLIGGGPFGNPVPTLLRTFG